MAIWKHRDDADVIAYTAELDRDGYDMHKVVLEVKGEPQLQKVKAKLDAAQVASHVWLERPENIATALATKPCARGIIKPLMRGMRLFK